MISQQRLGQDQRHARWLSHRLTRRGFLSGSLLAGTAAAGWMNLEELFLVAAIQPGDDFLAVGMFDFNVAEDVSATRGILKGLKRERPWRGVTV